MLGNFFLLTCPRLYDLETVTYFGMYRNHHASFALNPITETTQFLLDVFRYAGDIYVRPIKVQHRSTGSMNTIHRWEGDEFRPITSSAVISEVLASSRWPGLRADSRLGFWRRIFHEAQQTYDDARAGHCPPEKEQEVFERLSRMVLVARRGHAAAGASLPRPGRHPGDPRPHDRHRADRRQDVGDAAGAGNPQAALARISTTGWKPTIRSTSAPTCSTPF